MRTAQAAPDLGDIAGCALSLPGCILSKGGKTAVDAVAEGAWEKIVKSFLESMVSILEKLSTFWMKFPDPKLTDPSKPEGAMIGPLQLLTDQLAGWVAVCSLLSIMWCCVRAVRQVSARPFGEAALQVVMVIGVQLGLAGAVQGGLLATSELSESLLSTTGEDRSLSGLVSVNDAMSSGQSLAVWFLLAVLAILSSLMQLMFMMMRGPLIMLLVLWMHFAAATAASEEGRIRAKKIIGLLISFMIYKPAAAAIYALGFLLIYGSGTEGLGKQDAFMNTMYGFMTVLIAAIALPAVIRFVVPLAAATSSNAFSGGAALGGVAAGSAMVATMGTSGAASAGRAAAGGSSVKTTTGSWGTSGTSRSGKGSGGVSSLAGGGGGSSSSGAGSAGLSPAAAMMGGGSGHPHGSTGSGGVSVGGGLSKGSSNAIPQGGSAAVSSSSSSSSMSAAPTAAGVSSVERGTPGSAARVAGVRARQPQSTPAAFRSSAPAGAGVKSGGVNASPPPPSAVNAAPLQNSSASTPAGPSGGGSAAPARPSAPPRPSAAAAAGGSASSWRPSGSPARTQGPGQGSTRPLPVRGAGSGPGRAPVSLPTWARATADAGRRVSSSDRLIPPGEQR